MRVLGLHDEAQTRKDDWGIVKTEWPVRSVQTGGSGCSAPRSQQVMATARGGVAHWERCRRVGDNGNRHATRKILCRHNLTANGRA